MGGAKAFFEDQREKEERRVESIAKKNGIECSCCGRTPESDDELQFFADTGQCPECNESDLKDD